MKKTWRQVIVVSFLLTFFYILWALMIGPENIQDHTIELRIFSLIATVLKWIWILGVLSIPFRSASYKQYGFETRFDLFGYFVVMFAIVIVLAGILSMVIAGVYWGLSFSLLSNSELTFWEVLGFFTKLGAPIDTLLILVASNPWGKFFPQEV